MMSAPNLIQHISHTRAPLLSRRMCAEQPPLLLPARRQRSLQSFQHQRRISPSGQDRLDDVRRQQREPQDLFGLERLSRHRL